MSLRVIFMGTPDFAVPALQALVDAGHEVAAVYCQPARPAGRGKKPRPSPVEQLAHKHGLAVRTPVSLKGPEEQKVFADLKADVAVVAAYGLILPQAILDAPKQGCINIHGSLLPRWRGAAPLHRAIMAGDTETGITIMQMDAGLDTGPMLLREATHIGATETTGDLHDRLAMMGARLIIEALRAAEEDHLTATPQPEEGVTYAHKIDKDEARIDWSQSASEVDCHIRGLSPFPGAWTEMNGGRVKILRSRLSDGRGKPGTVLSLNPLSVACTNGAVEVLELQRAGKGALDAATFLRGFTLGTGQVLGL